MTLLNVLLVEDTADNGLLETSLKNEGAKCLTTSYNAKSLALIMEIKPDIVIFNLATVSKKILSDLHSLNRQLPLPVIIFSSDDNMDSINQAMKADVSAYIVDGFEPQRLASIIQVALARFNQNQALKGELEDVRIQLEDRKQIDRAKAILIKTQNFTENEAYHTLRKLAMDRNITLGAMARNVIAMAELLK
jgi:response regulator NasT